MRGAARSPWLIGGRFVHNASRRRVRIAGTHRVAGNAHGEREDMAVAHARAVDRTMGRGGICVACGDWNSKPTDASLDPLRMHGWKCDQIELGMLPAHGDWCPDHQWHRRDKRIELVRHRTVTGTGSDHRPLIVTYAISKRKG